MSFNITDTTTLEDVKNYLQTNEFTEEIIQFLLSKGTNDDLNLQDREGYTALMFASELSNSGSSDNTVKMLIKAGANLDLQNNLSHTALMLASINSNTTSTENTVKMLIDAGADLNLQNNLGDTALILTCRYSNDTSTENTVKMLIDAGADLNLQTYDGNTALMISCRYTETSSVNTVKMLIDAGANLDLQDRFNGFTALIISIASILSKYSNNDYIVNMLIDAGANLDLKTRKGLTALLYCVSFENIPIIHDIIIKLINAGADTKIKHKSGMDAYDILYKQNPMSKLLKLINPEKDASNIYNQEIKVNTTKTVTFQDPIMMTEEEINIGEYINEDKDNVVFVYDKNRYFFTKRSVIMKQFFDAILYPCKVTDTMRPENIVKDKPLYDLKKIGFIGYPCIMNNFFINKNTQTFAIINTDISYPSFVSDNVLSGTTDYLSALHCQDGQESKVSYMVVAEPSTEDNPDSIQMGGKYKKFIKKNKKLIKKSIKKNKKSNKKTIRKLKNKKSVKKTTKK